MVRSRATKRIPVIYEWHGERFESDEKTPERRVADWFASKCARELFDMQLLKSKHIGKFEMQLSANVEEKLLNASQGLLLPGSEVIPLAGGKDAPAPMFEFRWGFHSALLPGRGRQVLVRHYDAEPIDHTDVIFGLMIHRKDVSGDDEEIHAEQNLFIDQAVAICRRCADGGWICD